MKLLAMLQRAPVLPALRLEATAHALPLARALVSGGLRMIEVSLHAPDALDIIAAIAADVPDAIVGASDVLTVKALKRATRAGARFALTPGFSARLSDEAEIPLLPGVATAGEIMRALEHGHDQLALFPAELAGGIPGLHAFAAAFPQVGFWPAGSIGHPMAVHYLAQPNVTAVCGAWLTPHKAVHEENWDHIQFLAHEAATMRRSVGAGA